jgi:aspartyl-tRNA(Asn)/glutamyl-tRNA(Gln) amidotransferase subunit A
MTNKDIAFLPVEVLSTKIQRREVSPVELTECMLDRIKKYDGNIKSYVFVADMAKEVAEQAQKEIKDGHYRGPLHGIPLAIKDNYLTKDMPTTVGTKAPGISFPLIDATTVHRLREAGAILIGKTNMHEFAWGNVTPPTRNPWNTNCVPGGSSGGSGAAVAASLCTAALGSDTGGSIRIPASLCGTVGLKATYGRVSKNGVITHSWSLDHAGPLTKTVKDAALLLNVLAGYDPKDPSSSAAPVPDYTKTLGDSIRDLKIGVCPNHFFDRNNNDVQRAVERAVDELSKISAGVVEFNLPNLRYGLGAIFVIELASSSCYHEKNLEKGLQRYYQPDVRTLVELGKFVTATDYLKAEQYRRVLISDLRKVFESVDVIVTPTTPITAWKLDQSTVTIGGEDESVLAASWRLTYPFNLTGLPAISIPCGFDPENVPIGLQIAGKPFAEETVLRVAYAYESRHDWKNRVPSL